MKTLTTKSKNMLTSQEQNQIQTVFERYHEDVISGKRPRKCKGKNGDIQITLPLDLAWKYANRAAGASGYLSDGNLRPGGIRLTPKQVAEKYGDQDFAIEWIMDSVEHLTDFILGSDKLGASALAKKIVDSRQVEGLELKLLKLAIEKKDNDLARLVLEGKAEQYVNHKILN